ncbi:unnamed protein product, partial [Ectocarpus sp. 8 AP-2014]
RRSGQAAGHRVHRAIRLSGGLHLPALLRWSFVRPRPYVDYGRRPSSWFGNCEPRPPVHVLRGGPQ